MHSVTISFPHKEPHIVINAVPEKVRVGYSFIEQDACTKPIVAITYGFAELEMLRYSVECLMSQDKVPDVAIFDSKIHVGLSVTPATEKCQEIVDQARLFGSKKRKISSFHISSLIEVDPEAEPYQIFRRLVDEQKSFTLWLIPPNGDVENALAGVTIRNIRDAPLTFYE